MYRVIRDEDGTELCMTEKVLYIKYGGTGTLVETSASDAIGVAVDSVPYNLFGHSEIPDAEAVLVLEADGGRRIKDVETSTADILAQLILADETAIELYEAHAAQEEINLAQDESLIEIYEMLG